MQPAMVMHFVLQRKKHVGENAALDTDFNNVQLLPSDRAPHHNVCPDVMAGK